MSAEYTWKGTVAATAIVSVYPDTSGNFWCDGAADEVEINAAITYLGILGGGTLILGIGTFNITSPVLIQGIDNLIFKGSGWTTVIYHVTPNTTDSIILIGDRANAALVSTGIVISDLMIEGSNQITATEAPEVIQASLGIDFESPLADPYLTNNCIVENCYVYNTGNDGIYGFYTDNIIVSKNFVSNTRSWWAGIHFHGVARYGHWTVVDNIVMSCTHGGIRHGAPIIGNRIYECGNEAVEECAGIITNMGPVIGNFIQGGYYGIWGYADVETIAINQLVRSDSGVSRYYGIYIKNHSEVSVTGNTIWSHYYDGITLENSQRCTVANNILYQSNRNGIRLIGSNYNTITGNIIRDPSKGYPNASQGILLESTSTYNQVADNIIWSDHANKPQYCIKEAAAVDDYNNIHDNLVIGYATGAILKSGINSQVKGNTGYITSGEPRFASGPLTAGVANAICFAWNNPETQDILIKKVVVEVTTAGGTVGSHLDVGIADDAIGTNRGTEFFDDLLLNTVQIDDSWVAGDGGTQTKWVFCEDQAAVANDWVVGQILDANAASLVGKYYIEYIGR